MKHLHKASGNTFDCGELIERDTCKTYDITVITFWNTDSEGDIQPPIIVGYYFGEYDAATTDYYIDEWLQKQEAEYSWLALVSNCAKIVEAYYVTNADVFKEAEYRNQRATVVNTLQDLKRIMDALHLK